MPKGGIVRRTAVCIGSVRTLRAHIEAHPSCRQVAVGGRNKYLINGSTAQLQRVQNLFHSVQLNVNNPHFLVRIMYMRSSISTGMTLPSRSTLASVRATSLYSMVCMRRSSPSTASSSTPSVLRRASRPCDRVRA